MLIAFPYDMLSFGDEFYIDNGNEIGTKYWKLFYEHEKFYLFVNLI